MAGSRHRLLQLLPRSPREGADRGSGGRPGAAPGRARPAPAPGAGGSLCRGRDPRRGALEPAAAGSRRRASVRARGTHRGWFARLVEVLSEVLRSEAECGGGWLGAELDESPSGKLTLTVDCS